MGEFKNRFRGYDMSGKVTDVIKAKEVMREINEARKEFPIPYDLLRLIASKGNGIGNVNTLKIKVWFEKWFE